MSDKEKRGSRNRDETLAEIREAIDAELQRSLGEMQYDEAVLLRRSLDNLREVADALKDKLDDAEAVEEPAPPAPPAPPATFKGSMYREPEHWFSQEQLLFVVDAVLSGAVDRIEAALPPTVPTEKWPDTDRRDAYIGACTDMVGIILPVLWAQLNDDGMEVNGYTGFAQFDDAVNEYVEAAIRSETYGDSPEEKAVYQLKLAAVRPNTRRIAEEHVAADYDEYLQTELTERRRQQMLELSAAFEGPWWPPAYKAAESARAEVASAKKDSIVPAVPLVKFEGEPFDAVLADLDVQLQEHWEMARPHLYRPEYRSGVAGGIRDARYVLNQARLRLRMLTAAGEAAIKSQKETHDDKS
jgi:hypothetical protein